jgi:primosomal protein N' (replication factor Y)
MPSITVCDVALDPKKGGLAAVWTYRLNEPLRMGAAVVVPLATRSELGFVLRVYETTEAELGFPLKSLRTVQSKIDGLGLPPELIELSRFVSNEYLCDPAAALAPALPPGVRSRLTSAWTIRPVPIPSDLSPIQKEVIIAMGESQGVLIETKGKPLSPAILRALQSMRKLGLVEKRLRVLPMQEARKKETLLRLNPDSQIIERFLLKEGKKRPAQALTLMQLQAAQQGAFTIPEIKAMAAVTESIVKSLVQNGLLEAVGENVATPASIPPEPNPAQKVAIDALVSAVCDHAATGFLLFGVTGSGKTEVYMRAAAEALRAGRQVLYIVPEIALAAQAMGLLRARFGSSVAVLHSNLSDIDRLTNWLRIRDGKASVVLGARSALFAPLADIGLIVVDEEHEQAYKQENVPRYHAKALAMRLSTLHGCPVIFGSATPSVESFYEAEQSELNEGSAVPDGRRLTLLTLPERTAFAKLPKVIVKDLAEGYRQHQASILTDELQTRMRAVLDLGQQTILFLNRRAYAPFMICRDCGHSMECPNCSVSLSFHRRDRRLKCHHCGFQMTPPEECPKCRGIRLAPFGAGTEKVEEAVSTLFPGVKVGRLDRDVVKKRGALEDTLAGFRSGEIQVLVGTQIVAKGLDFPNVTLVGVIAADVSLNLPDFRASERTYQLLSQVAGRAGRGAVGGAVVVQTLNPEHPAVLAAQTHDFLPFYETLKRERNEAGYPPFRRLVNIVVTGLVRPGVEEATGEIAERLSRVAGAQVLGPVDCAIERVLGKWRRHVLIKLPAYAPPTQIGQALESMDTTGVQVTIDVDPYTMM